MANVDRSIPIASNIYYFYLLFTSYRGTISPLRFTSHDNPHSTNAPTRFVKLDFGIGSNMTETEQDKETAAGKAKENNPQEHNSEERTRMLLADYETRLDEAAELIARVRHEINNPLAAVLGQAQLLLREELNEKARKRAEIIEELATRLRDIVAQLREIQRPVKSSMNNRA